ncbi:hypothetical protein D3C71_1847270 [compost metagenome]
MLLGADQAIEFLADLVGQAFAAAIADRFAVGAVTATQADHVAAEIVPGLLQGEQPVDAVDLLRVVFDHAPQAVQATEDARLGHFVGVEKTLVAGDQKAAHAGFHVD